MTCMMLGSEVQRTYSRAVDDRPDKGRVGPLTLRDPCPMCPKKRQTSLESGCDPSLNVLGSYMFVGHFGSKVRQCSKSP